MTKAASEKHHPAQGTKPKGPGRGDDGAKAVPVNPTPKDAGPPRGGGGHPKHPHSGESS